MNYFDTPMPERVYLQELQNQCKYSLLAIDNSFNYLHSDDLDNFWYHIQMFIVSVANVHKMIHGTKKQYGQRHQKLMDKYDLPKIHFLKEKQIRNRFEHYDERIVDWIDNSKNHNIVLNSVFPEGSIIGDFDIFKRYDPDKNRLFFDDKQIDIKITIDKLILLNQCIQETLAL